MSRRDAGPGRGADHPRARGDEPPQVPERVVRRAGRDRAGGRVHRDQAAAVLAAAVGRPALRVEGEVPLHQPGRTVADRADEHRARLVAQLAREAVRPGSPAALADRRPATPGCRSRELAERRHVPAVAVEGDAVHRPPGGRVGEQRVGVRPAVEVVVERPQVQPQTGPLQRRRDVVAQQGALLLGVQRHPGVRRRREARLVLHGQPAHRDAGVEVGARRPDQVVARRHRRPRGAATRRPATRWSSSRPARSTG